MSAHNPGVSDGASLGLSVGASLGNPKNGLLDGIDDVDGAPDGSAVGDAESQRPHLFLGSKFNIKSMTWGRFLFDVGLAQYSLGSGLSWLKRHIVTPPLSQGTTASLLQVVKVTVGAREASDGLADG